MDGTGRYEEPTAAACQLPSAAAGQLPAAATGQPAAQVSHLFFVLQSLYFLTLFIYLSIDLYL